MKTMTLIAAGLLATIVSIGGCKGSDKRGDVGESRPKVEEGADPAGIEGARQQLVGSIDRWLQVIDSRMTLLTDEVPVDRARVAALRAEAASLRAHVADPQRSFAAQSRGDFERLARDMETALATGVGAAARTSP